MNRDGSSNLNNNQVSPQKAYRSFLLRIQRCNGGWEIQLANLQDGREVKFRCPTELLQFLDRIFQAE